MAFRSLTKNTFKGRHFLLELQLLQAMTVFRTS
jgi:hypothetical protein